MKPWLAAFAIVGTTISAPVLLDDQFHRPKFVARAAAQHAPRPAQMRPELDNDSMLVLRIRMAPHEKIGMHDVSERLVVWLTDAHLRDTKADGTTTEYRRAAGAVDWIPAQRHAGENLSDKTIEFLAILPKSGPPPAGQGDQR